MASQLPRYVPSTASLLLLVGLCSSLCPAAAWFFHLPRALRTPTYPQGVLRTDGSRRPAAARLLTTARQAECADPQQMPCFAGAPDLGSAYGPTPGPAFCCDASDTCCATQCCPAAFPVCGVNDACVNDAGESACVDPLGVTFAGTPCTRGPACCGRDPVFRFCPGDERPQCADENGFLPCVIDGTPLPGVPCGANTCCPDPLRCCGDRCCNRDGTGGPVALESAPASPSPTVEEDPFPSAEITDVPDEALPEISFGASPSASASAGAPGGRGVLPDWHRPKASWGPPPSWSPVVWGPTDSPVPSPWGREFLPHAFGGARRR